MTTSDAMRRDVEELKLPEAISHLLDECRMVLPGIQALFGFQMVAVFSSEFGKLTPAEQKIHVLAIVLVVLAVALLMAPASLHRQAEPRFATERFLRVGTRLLLAAMFPLSTSICLDVFLVARIVWQRSGVAVAISAVMLVMFFALWSLLPIVYRSPALTGTKH